MKRLTIGNHACTEILALLIHLAWADGRLADEEKEGIRAASTVFNLTKEQRARLDDAMTSPLPLDHVVLEALSHRDQAFAFVAAVWLSGVDDDVDPKEQAALDHVASLVGIDAARAGELTKLARDLEPRKGDAKWAESLVSLFKSIPPRLEVETVDAIEVAFEEA